MYAVKIFKIKNGESLREIYREIILLRELELCNNFVQLIEVYKGAGKLYFVMSYAKHGPLLDHLQKNPNLQERDIRMIMS